MLNHSGSVPQVPIVFIISFLILLFLIPVQADAPINYNKELASDVELRGTFFTDDNADGFYVSLIGENSIQIDSDIHYIDKIIKIKKTALDSRFKKFNGINIGVTHISDDGIVNNYISPVIVDGEFVYITVDFSTVIINGMTGTTTTTLNGLSGNQSISVPIGSSYDFNITNNQAVLNGTGGTVTQDGNDYIHTFTSSGDFEILGGITEVKVLLIGGGGGALRAGGGGGGYVYDDARVANTQIYPVVVGSGGLAGEPPTAGGNSTYDGLTAIGGGIGPGFHTNGGDGGSGGGGGISNTDQTYGGTGSQGGDGGGNANRLASPYPSGGGGGAGQNGFNAPSADTAGDGGDGTANSISGSSVTYAGGGGGATHNPGNHGSGGAGGGGSGAIEGVSGTDGLGGGGGGSALSGGDTGDGGDGVVIIRYTSSSDGSANITVSITGDNNTQNYNTSQSREFILTPTGETNNVLVNTTSTDYDVTVTTYWTDDTTLIEETVASGYVKQYINYTPSANITSADLNTTIINDLTTHDYLGTTTSTLNDVSKTTTRVLQEVNASVGVLTKDVIYLWNITIPYNNVPTVGIITNETAYLGTLKSFTAPSFNDPEGLPINTHYWQFGDGDTSSVQNSTHTYTSIGIFNANYTVTETATVSPQAVLREFTVDVEVQPPQDVTTVPHQTSVSIDWDDYAYADKYSVYELEDGFPYVDTNPTVDGVKDAIYDCAHEFLIFSPNPVNSGDYETSYPVRTALGAYFFHEAVDNDDKLSDDDLIYYFDLDNDGLSVDDSAWKITNNNVKKYLWNGGSWAVTGVGNAVGASTGGGTHYPKHELFIPIAELGGNWTNGSTVKVLVKREDSALSPDVVTWYPYGNINDTDTSLWQEMVLNQPNTYNLLANVTLSNYTATNLTPFTIYHGAVSAWNGSTESSYTLFDVITEDLPIYNASGYVLDIDGNPITNATVYSCNGFVHEITQTDIYGYWIGYNFRNDTYTICANATGYVSNSTSITVAGVNLTNINITLIAEEIITVSKYHKIGEMFFAIPTILSLVFQKIADVIPIIVVLVFIMLIINVIGVAIHAIRVWR